MNSAGFLALWDAGDEQHATAIRLQADLVRKRRRFVTSEYIVDETATLLLVRHSHRTATDFLETIERTEAVHLEWIGPERFFAAAAVFRRHTDKAWSFTDCVSFPPHAGTAHPRRLHDRSPFQTGRLRAVADAVADGGRRFVALDQRTGGRIRVRRGAV